MVIKKGGLVNLKLFFVFTIFLGLVVSVIALVRFKIYPSKAQLRTVISISPSKIKPSDGYKLTVNVDGKPYNGNLDYDLTLCNLDLTGCTNISGQWKNPQNQDYVVVNGIVNIPVNQNFPEKYYLVRFKPRNYGSDFYSNFDILTVDSKNTFPQVAYSPTSISLPTRGSYVLYQSKDPYFGTTIGYTRMDVETDDCDLGEGLKGTALRITKTRNAIYWVAGQPLQIRFCIREESLANGNILTAIGDYVYSNLEGGKSTPIENSSELSQITGDYSISSLSIDKSLQGLLGGYFLDQVEKSIYYKDTDMKMHYALLPLNRKIPQNISTIPITIIEQAYGHPFHAGNDDKGIDIWHMEALQATNTSSSQVKIRYIETGYDQRLTRSRWAVTEDWDWNINGLITRIEQWSHTNIPRCWTPSYRCTSGTKTALSEMIESYTPDNNALTFSLRRSGTPQMCSSYIHIPNGESYDFLVTRSNGQPYSGFIELETDTGSRSIWFDKERRPMYVSAGRVKITTNSYGNLANFRIKWRVRPYLTNSTTNSLYTIGDSRIGNLKPNTSISPFSNFILFEMGNPPGGATYTAPCK